MRVRNGVEDQELDLFGRGVGFELVLEFDEAEHGDELFAGLKWVRLGDDGRWELMLHGDDYCER